MRLVLSLAAALFAVSVSALAAAPDTAPAPATSTPKKAPLRTPCSGKKGGVDHCENGKFICKDGTTSASKKVCTPPDKKAG
jgi:hypothetical protein